jgi:hypothetical protein
MSDRDVASAVRRAVEEAGGSRWVPVRWLRDRFGRTTLTRKARAEIRDALAGEDVFADPNLEVVGLNDNVRLYLGERARVPEPDLSLPAYGSATPNLWQRFRAWPAWAQWGAAIAALVLVVGVFGGGESSDDGGSDQEPAQQASTPGADEGEEDEALERERARERKRARARRKRERARERERIRDRRERRERRREEARERREREAATPPAEEEEPSDSRAACDPNYSGCVPSYPPDVDCPDVDGPVTVTGSDPHGLDADNDGEGCEN